MPERIEKLKEIIGQLENELASLDTVDEQAQAVLSDAIKELRTALGKKETDSLQTESLIERLRAAEGDFQMSHPTLSGIVLRMINALAQLGI